MYHSVDCLVIGIGLASTAALELAGTGNLRTREDNVLPGFWTKTVVGIDIGKYIV